MEVHDKPLYGRPTRWREAAILAFALLNIAVYMVRIVSVWHFGTLFATSGAESAMIYSVWKAMRHLPVYEWPFRFPFSLSLYNYLFYTAYSWALRMIGAWDAQIMTWGRQLTLVFAVAGAVAQWALVRGLARLRTAMSALSFLFALGLWLCTSLIKYWAVTVRPDVAAAALAMIALLVLASEMRFRFALAGVLFYLAWAFKQSVVLALAGVCLYLLLNRLWRDLALLTGIFAVLVAVTLGLGTPEYRFSILTAPQLVRGFGFNLPWLGRALGTGLTAIGLNLYWVAAPLVLWRTSDMWRDDKRVRLLTVVFVVALLGGVAGMGKIGGTSNYLFEAFCAGSTLLQLALFTTRGPLLPVLVAMGGVQPALQLGGAALGFHHAGRRDIAAVATRTEYADAQALAARLAAARKPIFTTDGPMALPWIATQNDGPAITLDPNFYEATRDRYENGGVEGMLQRGEFASVVISDQKQDRIFRAALNPNYRKTGESMQQGVRHEIYELSRNPPSK